MPKIMNSNPATGWPGIQPRWTRSDKHGLGTAYSDKSRVWYTVSKGILNEVYYPTIDQPQVRDLQLLITDGVSFFQGERELDNIHECLRPGSLGYRITNVDPQKRYRIEKEVIAAPDQDCILIHTRIEGVKEQLDKLRIYVLLSPHLEVGGSGNNGNVVETTSGKILTANKGSKWLALGATIPFLQCSCGFVGATDGWHEIKHNFKLLHNFDCAINGNIALTGELDLSKQKDFVLGLSFGDDLDTAIENLEGSLAVSFEQQRAKFNQQWQNADQNIFSPAENVTGDKGRLYHFSRNLIRAHEDKTYKGAIIASLSIPWGEICGDKDVGGYHLVWTRDMCHSATGLLAAGVTDVPLRALKYLATNQREDGGFFQNFFVNGDAHWTGIQLDETAMPIILAWRLMQLNALDGFDPYPMVLKAAGYLIDQGPVTPQERWEENSGFSPSTLATQITALICAATFMEIAGDKKTSDYFQQCADFLEAHLEEWTVTTQGTLVPEIPRHYIRIHPAEATQCQPNENANDGTLNLRNRCPETQSQFPGKEIVDAGFLELVRYGIRCGGDPLIENSLQVIDKILEVRTEQGSSWRRYNHDGYGQRRDGSAYSDWGYGHAWPVLTGERGHYELAAGRNATAHLHSMEAFASHTHLIPEQVWSLEDIPQAHMFRGRPTGGAMPLVWAHAEYLQLVRSICDGQVFARVEPVYERYKTPREGTALEIWKFNRQVSTVRKGSVLRIQANAEFQLHWTHDQWSQSLQLDSTSIKTGHHFVDIKLRLDRKADVQFTFYWTQSARWEGRNYQVVINDD